MPKLNISKVRIPKVRIPRLNVSKIREINYRGIISKATLVKILALLSYLHALIFIPLVLKKKSPFVSYHIKQGTILLFVWLVFSFSFYFDILPWFVGLFLLFCLFTAIANVFAGKERPLPIIGKLAK